MDLIIQLHLENIGSSLPKSVGEGIGISPSPLPKGWWRETGNVYKSAGWMLKPSNTTRLGYKKKSVGSPGSLGLSIIYWIQEFCLNILMKNKLQEHHIFARQIPDY